VLQLQGSKTPLSVHSTDKSPLYEHFAPKREKQPSFYGAGQAAYHKLIIIEI